MSEKVSVTVEATVNVPVAKAWKLWNEPEHITKWYFASPDWHAPSAVNDVRSGGKYSIRMEAKDGSFGFDFAGDYDNVIENALMDGKIGDGRKLTIKFTSIGGSTTITETFEVEDENSVEMQRSGWQAIVNQFKTYAESLPNTGCETPAPNGMKLSAHLYLRGNAAEARDFYCKVLGGTIPWTGYWKDYKDQGFTLPEGKEHYIMHTSVQFGTNCIMFCDSFQGEGVVGDNCTLSIAFDELEKLNQVYNDLASDGGGICVPLAPQFWGAHYGLLKDKFGIIWGLSCCIKEEKK